MIAKWNSDINDGGKWLCGKVSSQLPLHPVKAEPWARWRDSGADRWELASAWRWSASCRLQQSPAVSTLQSLQHTRRQLTGRTSLCRITQLTMRQFSETTISPLFQYLVSLRPPTLVCHSQVHPTLTPDTKFRFENVRESTIISYSWKSMFKSCNNSKDLSTDPT